MSYDAMTAHVSIVFARYTMLSLEQRGNAAKWSIGDLFFSSYNELHGLRYMDALLLILKKLIDNINERILFMGKELDGMLEYFLEKLPLLWYNCLKQCSGRGHLRSHIALLCITARLFEMCEVGVSNISTSVTAVAEAERSYGYEWDSSSVYIISNTDKQFEFNVNARVNNGTWYVYNFYWNFRECNPFCVKSMD